MSKKLQRQLAGLSKEKLYRLAESHYNGQVKATRALIAVLSNTGGTEYITKETLDGIPEQASYVLEQWGDGDGWVVKLVLPEAPVNEDGLPQDEAGICDIEANG